MQVVDWLVTGGIIAIGGSVFAYLNYTKQLKEQIEKETIEKTKMNVNLQNLEMKMDKISLRYDEGIKNYYEMQRDFYELRNNFENLVRRYNREHDSADFIYSKRRKTSDIPKMKDGDY